MNDELTPFDVHMIVGTASRPIVVERGGFTSVAWWATVESLTATPTASRKQTLLSRLRRWFRA